MCKQSFGQLLTRQRPSGYPLPVTSKKGVVGFGDSCNHCDKSRSFCSADHAASLSLPPVLVARWEAREGLPVRASGSRFANPSSHRPHLAMGAVVLVNRTAWRPLMAPSSSYALVLGNVSVRQIDGLFSLNDLHVAAGGESKHQPAKFTALESTKALVAEIGNSPDSESLRIASGRNGGTYACRELVIAYAAWISAAFHLKVIRVFLEHTQSPQQHATPLSMEDQRLLVTFLPNGQVESKVLRHDVCVLSPTHLPNMLTLVREFVPNDILLEMMRHAFERLSKSVKQH
jgi:hypothetical protein